MDTPTTTSPDNTNTQHIITTLYIYLAPFKKATLSSFIWADNSWSWI